MQLPCVHDIHGIINTESKSNTILERNRERNQYATRQVSNMKKPKVRTSRIGRNDRKRNKELQQPTISVNVTILKRKLKNIYIISTMDST